MFCCCSCPVTVRRWCCNQFCPTGPQTPRSTSLQSHLTTFNTVNSSLSTTYSTIRQHESHLCNGKRCASRVKPLLLIVQSTRQGCVVWGSNPGGSEIFHPCPSRTWGPPSLLYNGYQVSFHAIKWPGRGVANSPLFIAEVKERVELYLLSPFDLSWQVK